jgi:choline dehydrogenase-like flavoprotein
LTNTSVRRIQLNRAGEATSLVYQENDSNRTKEHQARIIVVAGGALESARLLLLSTDGRHPDGLGNQGGHVGRNLTFHSMWTSKLGYNDPVYPGRFGGITGQSHQFLNAPTRGRHASVKVEFSENRYNAASVDGARSGSDILERSRKFVHWRDLTIHAESVAGPGKYVFLSETTDRFGDPFAHIHYELDEFDAETFAFGERIVDRFREATGAGEIRRDPIEAYDSGAHHMGTCRMGAGPHDSVVDSFGRVHGIPNLFVLGGSCFVGSSGAVNPTLTMTALAIRSANFVMDQLLS